MLKKQQQVDINEALCERKLIEVSDFALLIGLFRNGYTKRKYPVPTQYQVDEYYPLVLDSTKNSKLTSDEKMMNAMGKWPTKIFGENPTLEFSKFHEFEATIKSDGCNLIWKRKPSPTYFCKCS